MASPNGLVRAQQVNVIDNSQDQTAKFVANQANVSAKVGKVIFNRRTAYAGEIAQGYLKHFSPDFLFFNGDGNKRHGVNGVGVMYLWAAILIIPGIVALFKIKDKKLRNIILLWILIAPIPAAVSYPTPHALRSLNMIPIPQILCSLGFFIILSTSNFADLKSLAFKGFKYSSFPIA